MTPAKRERLRPWLGRLYHACETPNEYRMMSLLFIMILGYDPTHGMLTEWWEEGEHFNIVPLRNLRARP